MVYYTTNSTIYDSQSQQFTVPGALYNKKWRYRLFPLLNDSVFNLVEIKRGGTVLIAGNRFPAPNAVIKIVAR